MAFKPRFFLTCELVFRVLSLVAELPLSRAMSDYAQLPLEASALPKPWFSHRTHFMVISRQAHIQDLARRNDAMVQLAIGMMEDAASLLLNTGLSGANAALGGISALTSAAKAAGKGDPLSALTHITNLSYADRAAKFLFGHRRDPNWEPVLCSRVRSPTSVLGCDSRRFPDQLRPSACRLTTRNSD